MLVEIAEGVERRSKRRFRTAEEKRHIVEATLSSSASVASVARKFGINANQIFHWRKLYHAGLLGSSSRRNDTEIRLLPVAIEEVPSQPAEVKQVPSSGAIHIEIPGRALISVEGSVDSALIRTVLEIQR